MSRFQSIFPLARVKFSSLGPLKPFYHFSSSWRIFSFWCKHLKSLQSTLYLHTVTCTVTTSYSTTSIDPVLTNLISDIFQIKKFFRVSCVVGRLNSMSVVSSEISFCFLSVALIFFTILTHLGFTPTDSGKEELM